MSSWLDFARGYQRHIADADNVNLAEGSDDAIAKSPKRPVAK
jgi:hypothetical protein